MACELADDDYLVTAWPQVVISSPGQWLVVFVAAAAGDYTVTVNGVPYGYTADGTEMLAAIRDEVLSQLSMALTFGASPAGTAAAPAIIVTEIAASGMTVAASGPSGPAPSEVTLTQIAGADNSAQRAFYLERAACGVPDCCWFSTCEADYTFYHASLAAYMILLAISTGPDGVSGADAKRMELGPAKLERMDRTYGSATATDLGRNEPGKTVLMLRSRYLPQVMCG